MQEDMIKRRKWCRRRVLYKGGMMQEDILKGRDDAGGHYKK